MTAARAAHAACINSPLSLPTVGVHVLMAGDCCSTVEVASTDWTQSTADVRDWLDAGAAMAGGGAAETALTEALAEAASMFAMPSHAGEQTAMPLGVIV